MKDRILMTVSVLLLIPGVVISVMGPRDWGWGWGWVLLVAAYLIRP